MSTYAGINLYSSNILIKPDQTVEIPHVAGKGFEFGSVADCKYKIDGLFEELDFGADARP